MKSNFYLLKTEIKERGLLSALKMILRYILKPLFEIINRNDFLIEIFYGAPAKPFYLLKPKEKKFAHSDLSKKLRGFWYSNMTGDFDLDGEKISRQEIFKYGGPNSKFKCAICQKQEWLSRIRQRNLFKPHSCSQTEECESLCKKQGDELWTQFHQNFDFSLGCDASLSAPKCVFCVMPEAKERLLDPGCDILLLILRRRLAYSCQVDIATNPHKIKWSDYDFAFISNLRALPKFSRPKLPIIMYGHDFWPLEEKKFQKAIDWLRPDIFLTPYPSAWKEYFKFPSKTEFAFSSFFDSLFFARPNLNKKKDKDLLVIGALTSAVYGPRLVLRKQIEELKGRYRIEFSQLAGDTSVYSKGPLLRKDNRTQLDIKFLNKWSEYLGSANYVIFGRMQFPILVSKYYEVLGSGAVPIFPEVDDLKYLGLKAYEHYIPLSEVEGNNQKLSYFLENYEKFSYISENAAKWYRENSNKFIFDEFEEIIRKITNYKFQKRLV